jgi:hypothetical protein
MTIKPLQNTVALISLVLVAACASASEDTKVGVESAANNVKVGISSKQESVYSKMASLIGNASCETDSHCASIPVGNAACGGPVKYMVYSNLIGDEAVRELTDLSNETKELDIAMAKENQTSGNRRLGICQFITPSEVACVDRVCTAMENEIIR